MTLYGVLFYLLGATTVISTLLAVSRRNVVHAVVYLIISFFATGLLFLLLGAPFLAVLEVMVYAGAIMVLFLFVVMMLKIEPSQGGSADFIRQWLPAIALAVICLATTWLMILAAPENGKGLPLAMASPSDLGRYLFREYWLSVEIASLLLFAALVGALYLGRHEPGREQRPTEEES